MSEYTKSRGKNQTVICRVKDCFDKNGNKTSILSQNYGRHLARYHPSEDAQDLSPHSDLRQVKLSFRTCQVATGPTGRGGAGMPTSVAPPYSSNMSKNV